MEEQKDINLILELMMQPAFCVEGGIITQLNKAARQLLLEPGTPIDALLPPDTQEYAQLQTGCLYLTMTHASHPLGVSVTRANGSDIFVVESEANQSDLRTLALTALGMRQPLSDMITSANHLLPIMERIDDPGAKEHIAHMNQRLYQMHRMVCNMSDAARYSDCSSANLSCRDVCAVVSEIFERAAELVSHCGITLQFSVPQASILCLIDDQLLERAVYNMISNAVKFNTKGSIIQASLTRRGQKLYLSVEDRGNGIPRSIIGSVYSRYQRQPGLEDSRFGLGLGLVLVRAAATVHGGTVLIDQPNETGTRITMSLAIDQGSKASVRSDTLRPDYAGERDHGLIELSDVLPAQLYLTAF